MNTFFKKHTNFGTRVENRLPKCYVFCPWKCSFKIQKVAKYYWKKNPYNMNRKAWALPTFPAVTWPCTRQVSETYALGTHFLIFCFLILKWKSQSDPLEDIKLIEVRVIFIFCYRGLSQDPERNGMLLGINLPLCMHSLEMGRNKNNSF